MNTVRIVCGPTASGKSSLVLHLARAMNAEILSIDSMKIYRGLDIGTAKPSAENLKSIPHHLVNIREPWESYSVAEFLPAAEAIIADCSARKKQLIGEGGTALYLKTFSEGLFAGPSSDEALRKSLEDEAERVGVAQMHQRLQEVDAAAAKKIMNTDVRRIVRALEVHTMTGKPISEWQSQWGTPREDLDVRLACLRLPRPILYARIDQRIHDMMQNGWLNECRDLLELAKPLSRAALQALGYKTLFSHLRSEMTLKNAVERICFDTHHFARRQLNWFRRIPKLVFIDIDGTETVADLAPRVLEAWGNG